MSYTLAYKGAEIDEILGRAATGGALDTAIAAKQDALTFDAVPTEGSTNPAESGGIYDAIQAGGAAALAAFPTDSVSGDVVSFSDGADSIPVKAFTGSILPAQSGSGDPAPDNVRPISGWTGANITRCGKNLYDAAKAGNIVIPNGATRSGEIIRITAGDWTVSRASSGTVLYYAWNDGTAHESSMTSVLESHLTAAADCDLYLWVGSGANISSVTNLQVEKGSTATTYEAYNGSAIVLTFGQTVYAGTLTALGGGLWSVQATHAIVDLGDLTWTYGSVGVNGFMYTSGLASAIVKPSTTSEVVPMVADHFKVVSADGVASQSGALIGVVTNGNVRAKYDGFSSASFASDVSGWMLVYPLAALPAPITITGEDLQTLLGANTVWTDVGAVTELEYRADTALYIQKLLNGGGTLSLSMAAPSPSLSLGRVGVLAEPEEAEPEQTEEEVEQTEEPEQTEEE